MTFTVAQDRRLWQILKPGKASVDPEALYRCSQMAITRYTELCGILKKSLEGIADLNLS